MIFDCGVRYGRLGVHTDQPGLDLLCSQSQLTRGATGLSWSISNLNALNAQWGLKEIRWINPMVCLPIDSRADRIAGQDASIEVSHSLCTGDMTVWDWLGSNVHLRCGIEFSKSTPFFGDEQKTQKKTTHTNWLWQLYFEGRIVIQFETC